MDVITIETPSLGDRSYVVHDGEAAIVIDPQRDLDRVESALDGLELTHVLETHVHNDYVTGGLELSRRSGAQYVMAADDAVTYPVLGVRDGDELTTGRLTVQVLHTPGHTFTHLAYVVAADGRQVVATGGSLLHGTVGRPDLLGPTHTPDLARAQHRSAALLASRLGDHVEVLPTHGFGSFCSSIAAPDGSDGTMAGERRVNVALTEPDEDAFVRRLLGGLTAYPRYYAHMAPINLAGPSPADLMPPVVVDAAELRRRVAAGHWVVDVRGRSDFAAAHLRGSVNVGVDGSFATYLGWTLPWGMPVTIVADTAAQVEAAQRDLLRIGIDRPLGQAVGGPGAWAPQSASYPVRDFAALRDAEGVVVVDVRRDDEWDDVHLDAASLGVPVLHVPLPDLMDRLPEVPVDRPSWVHCQSGYRAAVGASLLDRAGYDVVLIDDEMDAVHRIGLPTASAP